ncbi:hypothetical protein [Acidovorax kalamii]|uniref:hypothetical protein n=1 Tax=Acidovorax kalamii TaxID=2004485 RepID=UPI001F0A158F|nr:hypothetical protein [Acidovorax kalamii]
MGAHHGGASILRTGCGACVRRRDARHRLTHHRHLIAQALLHVHCVIACNAVALQTCLRGRKGLLLLGEFSTGAFGRSLQPLQRCSLLRRWRPGLRNLPAKIRRLFRCGAQCLAAGPSLALQLQKSGDGRVLLTKFTQPRRRRLGRRLKVAACNLRKVLQVRGQLLNAFLACHFGVDLDTYFLHGNLNS